MDSRRKGREIALQVLYLSDVTKSPLEKSINGVLIGSNLGKKTTDFCRNIIYGTLNNQAQIDDVINKYCENWELKRMAAIDRNILRMGAYEIIFTVETPVSVIIDEAVEIAKFYSTLDSGKFVNGILDKIKNERKPEIKNEQTEVPKS